MKLSLTFNNFLSSLLTIGNFFTFLVNGFNLDVDTPVFKIGPADSYFGYAVAGHFMNDRSKPVLIIGAPRGQSEQPETTRAGAVYSCPINRFTRNPGSSKDYNKHWCEIVNVEYDSENFDKYSRPPDNKTYYAAANFSAKQDQLLGSVIAAGGTPKSNVMVCAPNLVFDKDAYIDGQCYLLQNNLSQFKLIHTCHTWSKAKRHNEWGTCQEGFSASMREDLDVVVTGLPGAKRWVGGANVQEMKGNRFQQFTTQITGPRAVEDRVPTHSYLGFSVGIGMFGFGHEEKGEYGSFSIVAGATRYNETGAVFILPSSKSRSINVRDLDKLLLTSDNFNLTGGDDFASTFGYSLHVTDIDSNGFDDLAVGAPHYFDASHSNPHGGAVFVYFSSGKKQDSTSNNAVFEKPYKLLGPKFSQFGTAITGVDLNRDKFNDIIVGAPFDQKGGAVYVYLGSAYSDFDVKPSQVIFGRELHYNPLGNNLNTFGWSLFGGSDLDNNNYPDVVVGAFNSNSVVLLRTKPVLNFLASVDESLLRRYVDKDSTQQCGLDIAKACFKVATLLSIVQTDDNIDWGRNYVCRLEVLPSTSHYTPYRAQFYDGSPKKEWSCKASRDPIRTEHELFILESNRDWLNPINMKFSVHLNARSPPEPTERGDMININDYPIIAKKGSEKNFNIEFDNKCSDRVCDADLSLKCDFSGLTKEVTGMVIKNVGEGHTFSITYTIMNNAERAYETLLYVQFDDTVFEVPEIANNTHNINQGKQGDGIIEYFIANPMPENQTITFSLIFRLIQQKSGLKTSLEPLRFDSYINTTSNDINGSNNNCSMDVRVVIKAELELQGSVMPDSQLLYGGRVMGASAMKFFEDAGNEVQHIYTLTNEGPSSLPEAKIIVDFPYEVNSTFREGKYALYITDMPQVQVKNQFLTSTNRCEVDIQNYRLNPINPFDLLALNELKTNESELNVVRLKRSPLPVNESWNPGSDLTKDEDRKLVLGRRTRELRIKPTVNKNGEKVVTIHCTGPPEQRTAKCVTITCLVRDLAPGGTATVTIYSRLWNSTFIEDYRDVNQVEIISFATVKVDKRLGLLENTLENNDATATTYANPDLPAITEKAEIPIWIIILAVCGGVFLLLCIIILLWKCGFFNRKRHADQPLYKAEYKHNDEYDS